ncbi:hypothetical protein [Dryocola sp. LX212]
MYYISLFGLSSLEDIYTSVYAAMHPRKAKIKSTINNHKDVDVGAAGISLSIGNLSAGLANTLMRENVLKDKIIIFDDLERSSLEPDEILGAINKYVEHHKCRVIAIAHDEKIKKGLTDTKEKVFGVTLRVTPQIDKVFDVITNDFRFEYIRNNFKNLIVEIFNNSESKSLRILKHIINDTVRLIDCLKKKHTDNTAAMKDLLAIFVSLNIECRTGYLKRNDIENRKKLIHDFELSQLGNLEEEKEEVIEPKISLIQSKYKTINFSSSVASDSSLINALFNGYYDSDEFNLSLDNSVYFIEGEVSPNWLIIYSFDKLDSDTVNTAIEMFLKEFDAKHFRDIGEILHAFHIKFLLSHKGVTENSFDDVEVECQDYIIDLITNNNLKDITEDRFFYTHLSDNYLGHAFWCLPEYNDNIKRLRKFIGEKQDEALINRYPAIAEELKGLFKSDIETFISLISYTYQHAGKYAKIDVLADIESSEFVDIWLSSPRSTWHKVKNALEFRYEHGEIKRSLVRENDWIHSVLAEIQERANLESGLDKYRIERLISEKLNGL